MTGQTLLDLMNVLDRELLVSSGEPDVTRALVALNAGQDYLESLLARTPGTKGDTTGTLTTSAATETTAFPTGVLRIDKLQYLDPSTSRPVYDLFVVRRTGGHIWNRRWPFNILRSANPGSPQGYWTVGKLIYWDPLPDGTHTIRWYGLQRAADITTGGTFAYDDEVALPLASFAVKLLRIGLDDGADDHSILAEQTFGPVLRNLAQVNRDGAVPLTYSRSHDT